MSIDVAPSLWVGGGCALGLLIGSYIATIAIRWPNGEGASRGRSRCDSCGVALRAADLIPILSYAVRRGRCGACGAAIDPTHSAMEIAAAGIGGIAFFLLPGWAALAGAAFGWLLLALGTIDLRHFWLPDRLTIILAIVGLCTTIIVPPALADRLIGAVSGFGALFVIAWGYARLRGKEGMGGGDPKLLGAIGLWLGWRALPVLLLCASLLGLLVALCLWCVGRDIHRDQPMPFGTLLAVAAWPLWLWQILAGPLL